MPSDIELYTEVLERAADVCELAFEENHGREEHEALQSYLVDADHLRALAKAMREAKENRVRGVPPNDQLVGYWIPLPEAP